MMPIIGWLYPEILILCYGSQSLKPAIITSCCKELRLSHLTTPSSLYAGDALAIMYLYALNLPMHHLPDNNATAAATIPNCFLLPILGVSCCLRPPSRDDDGACQEQFLLFWAYFLDVIATISHPLVALTLALALATYVELIVCCLEACIQCCCCFCLHHDLCHDVIVVVVVVVVVSLISGL